MPDTPGRTFTVRAVAETHGIRRGKVLAWIARGELAAINVADRADGKPRWRIPEAALETFLAGRAARPATPVRRVRRRRTESAVKQYF